MCAIENVRQEEKPVTTGDVAAPEPIIRAEVNLLRFPIFALSTKGLRTLDGIECRGVTRRNSAEQPYLLRITRNTASLFPGPLARRVHFALLGIATEHGFPIANPVVFSWRELCRCMGISYAGRSTIQEVKAAIRATHGIIIHSQEALLNRATGTPLPAVERGYHLYESYVFANEMDDDGTISDANVVTFADWYADNLNRLYTAPVDFALWQSLERKSPIASRLYEFLLLAFHSGTPTLRINYANLARMLPVKPERYPSASRRQMNPAFTLLVDHGILSDVAWMNGVHGDLQIVLRRPKPLSHVPSTSYQTNEHEQPEILQIQELRDVGGDENRLVAAFYEQYDQQSSTRATPRERELAQEVLTKYGRERAQQLIAFGVKQLKIHWPTAKTFGALIRYLPEAEADLLRLERRHEREQREQAEQAVEQAADTKKRETREKLFADWKPKWDRLIEAEQQAIEQLVAERFPHYRRLPKIFEMKCLEVLAQQAKLSNENVTDSLNSSVTS